MGDYCNVFIQIFYLDLNSSEYIMNECGKWEGNDNILKNPERFSRDMSLKGNTE